MKKPKFPLPAFPDVKNLKKTDKANKILFSSSFFTGTSDFKGEKLYMSDEELYYIATSVSDMASLRYQRAIFDMVHIQCDPDSVCRFLNFFSKDVKEKIMISC